MQGRLVLFDIDGTLIDTRGTGFRAFRKAVHDLHDVVVGELDLCGATDAGLVRGILSSFDLEVSEESTAAIYEAYLVRLAEQLNHRDFGGVVLPAVPELLEALQEAGAVLGLLTGNVEAGALLKLQCFGLDQHFDFGAFGNDHPDRNKLGPLALRRAMQLHGKTFISATTVIVGDTPKDIACGKALGSQTLAVATGRFSVDQLRAHGPTMVVDCFETPLKILSQLKGDPDKGS